MEIIENPFAPGTATMPPHVAGREEQWGLISETLRLITKPLVGGRLEQAPLAPIKIVGPRGVGKTTLLGLAEAEARRLGIHVVDIAGLPHLDPNGDFISSLLDGIGLRGWISLWLGSHFKSDALAAPASVSEQQRYYDRQMLAKALRARLRRDPVLLSLDEVMHYDVASLEILLQECQRMIGENLPLAVMMAGTPALDEKLGQIDATFSNRCQPVYINQISDEAVRDALRKPLLDNGVAPVADDALDLMASWTDNYPYFVQLAGRVVWRAMRKDKRNEVDLALAQGAEAAMQEERQGYYHGVYEKIAGADALGYASQVVTIVEDADPPLPPEEVAAELAAANDGMSSQEARKIFNLLLDNSLVWFADDGKVKAAHPSFFQYFKARRKRDKS